MSTISDALDNVLRGMGETKQEWIKACMKAYGLDVSNLPEMQIEVNVDNRDEALFYRGKKIGTWALQLSIEKGGSKFIGKVIPPIEEVQEMTDEQKQSFQNNEQKLLYEKAELHRHLESSDKELENLKKTIDKLAADKKELEDRFNNLAAVRDSELDEYNAKVKALKRSIDLGEAELERQEAEIDRTNERLDEVLKQWRQDKDGLNTRIMELEREKLGLIKALIALGINL